MKSKKGFIFTIDAMLGLVILIILISFPILFMNNLKYQTNYSPLTISDDVLKVLIEDDTILDAIKNDDFDDVGTYLNKSIPEQYGSYLLVKNSTGIVKNVSGLSCKTDKKFISRTATYYDKTYFIEVILC